MQRHLVAEFGQPALHLVGDGVELVAGVDFGADAGVFGPVRLGVGHHALDFARRQVRGLADRDRLLGARVLIAGRDVEDAVGVDVERRLICGVPRCGPDALSEAGRSCRRRSLPAGDDVDRRLVASAVLNVSVRRAGIVVLRSITFVITPPGDDAERQRRDVEQQDVFHRP